MMSTLAQAPRPHRSWLALVVLLLAVLAAGAIGSWVTLPKIPTWYAGLQKPSFNPPAGVFGPVWTVLYVMMALAAWRVLGTPATPARRGAMVLFAVQLGLNALWSPVFFGLERPRLALVVIVALLLALGATLAAFRRLDGLAALLLVPYFAWVAFATVLNAAIVMLNP